MLISASVASTVQRHGTETSTYVFTKMLQSLTRAYRSLSFQSNDAAAWQSQLHLRQKSQNAAQFSWPFTPQHHVHG